MSAGLWDEKGWMYFAWLVGWTIQAQLDPLFFFFLFFCFVLVFLVSIFFPFTLSPRLSTMPSATTQQRPENVGILGLEVHLSSFSSFIIYPSLNFSRFLF